jgi:hypothetical protein
MGDLLGDGGLRAPSLENSELFEFALAQAGLPQDAAQGADCDLPMLPDDCRPRARRQAFGEFHVTARLANL